MNPNELLQALTDLSKSSLRHKEQEYAIKSPYYCESFYKPRATDASSITFYTISDRNPNFLKALHVLAQIKNLGANWDNYDAIIPSYSAIKNVESFLKKLPGTYLNILDEEYIYPNPNGTISIEWRRNDDVISIEFGEQTANFFSIIKSKISFEESISNIDDVIPQKILDSLSIFSNS